MKTLVKAILLLSALMAFCQTLKIKPTFNNLLFHTNAFTLKAVIEVLFRLHNLDFLLPLVFYEAFDFTKFMPRNPQILEQLIRLLRHKNCPREIEERFYDFEGLQEDEDGKRFLMKINVNFARMEWNPFAFTVGEVKEILLKIQSLLPTNIEYLGFGALSHVLSKDLESNFFSANEYWNLFPISSFFNNYRQSFSDLKVISSWFGQVKGQAQSDDLLFYRLAFLSWYYWPIEAEFANSIRESLLSRPSSERKEKQREEFKNLVLSHYSREENMVNRKRLMDIPDFILNNNQMLKATLHFEHFLAAFEMGYKVSSGKISNLFQRFSPSLVLPFLCRRLLWYQSYCTLISILKDLPEWRELYYNTRKGHSYFPRELPPPNAQLRLWRHQRLDIKDAPQLRQSKVILNHPQLWKQYVEEEHSKLEETIAVEIDGFTFIKCHFEQTLIRKFIVGRIIRLLLNDRPLPRFIPLFYRYRPCLENREEHKVILKRKLPKSLCIVNSEVRPSKEIATEVLENVIVKVFNEWKVPKILCAFV